MPRIAIDYTNTIIYKIQHKDKEELIYVGHTTDFTKRKSAHKLATRSEKDKIYSRGLNKNYRQFRLEKIQHDKSKNNSCAIKRVRKQK